MIYTHAFLHITPKHAHWSYTQDTNTLQTGVQQQRHTSWFTHPQSCMIIYPHSHTNIPQPSHPLKATAVLIMSQKRGVNLHFTWLSFFLFFFWSEKGLLAMLKTLSYYILYMWSTFRSTENWSHFVFWREKETRGIEACTWLLYIL